MTFATVDSYSPFEPNEIVKVVRRETVDDIDVAICRKLFDTRHEVLVPGDKLTIVDVKELPNVKFIHGQLVYFASMMNPHIKGGTKVIIDGVHIILNKDGSMYVKCGVTLPNKRMYQFVDESDLMGIDESQSKKLVPLADFKVITNSKGVQMVVMNE